MSKNIPQILTDAPVDQLMNWHGFSAKRDKTMLPPTWLVSPSQNCLVPDGDKVIPRYGSQVVFQGSAPIIETEGNAGGYIKYKNFAGVEMDVKSYRDETTGEQVLVLFNGVYVPITTNPNLDLNGTGKIYFATYTDTNLDLSKNKRLPRLCWVNGYATDDNVPKGVVFSWTGGISQIATISANVITLPTGQTWRKLGFSLTPDDAAIAVTINGVEYTSGDPTELDTDTLTLNASPSAVVGNIVTSAIEVDDLAAPLEMLRMSKNYMYYGSEKLRQWYMSNQFGRPNNVIQTGSNAELDDMTVVSTPDDYTGTNLNTYRVQIVATNPAINDQTQTFQGTGPDTSSWVTGAYSASGRHQYKIVIIYDFLMTFVGGVTPAYTLGEIIVGQTSGSRMKVVDLSGLGAIGVEFISGDPQAGEQFKGLSSGTTSPNYVGGIWQNGAFPYKDNVLVTGIDGSQLPSGALQFSTVGNQFSNPAGIDDLNFTISQVGASRVGDTFTLDIEVNAGGPDEFGVSKNGGTLTGSTPITGSPQSIGDGLEVQFGATDGHSIGNWWDISANRGVTRPWADFYYTLDFNTQQSARRPGEGYVYVIPSPFNTMAAFENSMYLNTSDGNWGYTTPTLSADLKSEDISFTPLKQVGSSKVLYPYLIGHSRNDLIYIDENRNLQSLGRKILIEKVQATTMSNDVLNKFQSLSFLNGSILFQDNNINITSPEDNTMMVWNERKSYWQPPQYIPNLGLLTNIGSDMCVHSYLDTATRRLNDPTADGDDGVEYEVIVRNSTYDHGNRWMKKSANMAFWEGYIFKELPEKTMKMNLYLDPDGCAGIKRVDMKPTMCCEPTNPGNFGGGNDGDHEFGGAETHATDYARYQWDKLGVVNFYFSSIEFRCRTTKHTYEILSMGINLTQSKINNKEYRPVEDAIDSLLPI